MRYISKFAMTVAAIFFALAVSAHHTCDSGHSLGKKVYQVCKKWRVDQGGPMPTDLMQHCTNVLCQASEDDVRVMCYDEIDTGTESNCVGNDAREKAKNELGYW